LDELVVVRAQRDDLVDEVTHAATVDPVRGVEGARVGPDGGGGRRSRTEVSRRGGGAGSW
jgi:hypothetical protein